MPVQENKQDIELGEVQKLIVAGDLLAAIKALDELPKESQQDTQALYMRAVCCRHLGQLDEAESFLKTLLINSPNHSRAHQECGHLFKGLGRGKEALAAYARACRINPALQASWRAQLEILDHSTGSNIAEQRDHVARQLHNLEALPGPLRAIKDMLYEGKLLKAEHAVRRYLQKNPKDVEAMRVLAEIGLRFGVLEDAEFLLESAAEFAPENSEVRIDYIKILQTRQRFQRAHEEAHRLLELAPKNPIFQSLFAIQSMQVGDFQQALAMFDRVLETLPHDPITHVSRGHALKTSGDTPAAIESYQAALIAQPLHCDAYYSLANLKTYRFTDSEMTAMRGLIDSDDLSGMAPVHLNFALGKAFEDLENYEAAFSHYSRGNNTKQLQVNYTASETSQDFADQKRACPAKLFTDRAGMGCQAADPIFIVGLPRAGSTLLEQILSSHSQVDGTLELPNILSLSSRLRRRGRGSEKPYPDNLADLTGEELLKFGEQYIEDTRIHRQGAAYFIDKMPNNFRHIGLIKLILPNAKIIDARRAPMACCFSGYKQLFADGQLFSYSLADIGAYYKDYVDLMAHWDEMLPGYVLRVQHEDVVHDLETQVRRILDFCGLDFEESCLNFHETERSIRTPSSEQVRQPIFDSSLEQWRRFEPWLEPLKEALGTELVPAS
jgi:tetratricopeptide (TPR) repeat protein